MRPTFSKAVPLCAAVLAVVLSVSACQRRGGDGATTPGAPTAPDAAASSMLPASSASGM